MNLDPARFWKCRRNANYTKYDISYDTAADLLINLQLRCSLTYQARYMYLSIFHG